MATLSVEQSAYIKSQQQYLSDLKVSQFAKFLDKNPTYVTYYPVIQAQSSTDAGTGAIYEEIGPNSPMRYNKILQLPAFNLPELKPDIIQDEGGYDAEMDINDIAFIPGTVRPKPGDYMLVEISGVEPLLFRCNSYRHNTIKSNDYYMGDFDLVDINQQYTKLINKQVETTYTCHFENIGTNQKVFISEDEEDEISDIEDLITKLTDFYSDAFYNGDIDGFVLYNASVNGSSGSSTLNGNAANMGTQWYYDNYLTRFINESQIFANDSSDTTRVFPYLELLPLNFDYLYSRTVWNAVLKRTRDYLHKYTYAWSRMLQKRTSPLMLASYPTLHPTLELFDHYVKPEEPVPENLKGLIWEPGTPCGWNGADPQLRTYFSMNLLRSLADNSQTGDLNVLEKMIFDYVTAGIDNVVFDKKELINFSFTQNYESFYLVPICIYILKQHLASVSADS
jgi:hypothetical protein